MSARKKAPKRAGRPSLGPQPERRGRTPLVPVPMPQDLQDRIADVVGDGNRSAWIREACEMRLALDAATASDHADFVPDGADQ